MKEISERCQQKNQYKNGVAKVDDDVTYDLPRCLPLKTAAGLFKRKNW